MKKRLFMTVAGSYTVEAAGVFAVVFLTFMLLLNQAFRIRSETVGKLELHEEIERDRHQIANIEEDEISGERETNTWKLQITIPVFRPEKSLRSWSLLEEIE